MNQNVVLDLFFIGRVVFLMAKEKGAMKRDTQNSLTKYELVRVAAISHAEIHPRRHGLLMSEVSFVMVIGGVSPRRSKTTKGWRGATLLVLLLHAMPLHIIRRQRHGAKATRSTSQNYSEVFRLL